ncbi:hypothetical protein VTI74DRAFT_9619 [Chaetomium olivicolor]
MTNRKTHDGDSVHGLKKSAPNIGPSLRSLKSISSLIQHVNMSAAGIKIVFGGSRFTDSPVDDVEDVRQWLQTLEELGIREIDTAEKYMYGSSEELLGKAGAPLAFTISTKQSGGFKDHQPATQDHVLECGKASLQRLQTDSVDIYYLHAPDRRIPWKDTLAGIDALYKQGAFKRFGLSNFRAADIDEVVQVARDNNFVLPSVYQGNYSAVARLVEDEIFPALRRHGMAFYAYSPIAGGFLSKSKKGLTDVEGRFGQDTSLARLYNGMYNRPSFVAALGVWEKIAQAEGVSRAELAYRWVVHHSKLRRDLGDAVIVGARTHEQLGETVRAIKKGPLSDSAVKRIEEVWESVKGEALLDHWEIWGKF